VQSSCSCLLFPSLPRTPPKPHNADASQAPFPACFQTQTKHSKAVSGGLLAQGEGQGEASNTCASSDRRLSMSIVVWGSYISAKFAFMRTREQATCSESSRSSNCDHDRV